MIRIKSNIFRSIEVSTEKRMENYTVAKERLFLPTVVEHSLVLNISHTEEIWQCNEQFKGCNIIHIE